MTVTPSSRNRRAVSWTRRMALPGARAEQKSAVLRAVRSTSGPTACKTVGAALSRCVANCAGHVESAFVGVTGMSPRIVLALRVVAYAVLDVIAGTPPPDVRIRKPLTGDRRPTLAKVELGCKRRYVAAQKSTLRFRKSTQTFARVPAGRCAERAFQLTPTGPLSRRRGLAIPEAGRCSRQGRRQMGEHRAGQQGQFRQAPTTLRGVDEGAGVRQSVRGPEADGKRGHRPVPVPRGSQA